MATTWNYRIIKHEEPTENEVWFGLHEVHYNENGEVESWTFYAILEGNSSGDITMQIEHIVKDLQLFPDVLNWSELPKRKSD